MLCFHICYILIVSFRYCISYTLFVSLRCAIYKYDAKI
nr:MAG TPA: hypothetical protein [Caudoviricetes sp.]